MGSAGHEELSVVADELTKDGTVTSIRPTIRAGHKTIIAALARRVRSAEQRPLPTLIEMPEDNSQ